VAVPRAMVTEDSTLRVVADHACTSSSIGKPWEQSKPYAQISNLVAKHTVAPSKSPTLFQISVYTAS
jgi:hypothetical protein